MSHPPHLITSDSSPYQLARLGGLIGEMTQSHILEVPDLWVTMPFSATMWLLRLCSYPFSTKTSGEKRNKREIEEKDKNT